MVIKIDKDTIKVITQNSPILSWDHIVLDQNNGTICYMDGDREIYKIEIVRMLRYVK